MLKNKLDGQREKIFLLAIVLAFILIRFFCANFTKVITTYPDELRYYDIARSLFQGGGISYRNIPFDFQKIAYSLIIAPLFFIKNIFLRNSCIALLNAVLMTLSVIPIFNLSKKLNVASAYRWLILFIALLRPDMTAFPMIFSSENLYWILFSVFRNLWLESIESGGLLKSALAGLVCYFCYLCKEISLALLLSYIAFEFFEQLLFERRIDKKRTIKLSVFLSAFFVFFVLFKISVF
ncbi:MAG: hypothetical protein IJ673_03640, partial [Treponema sp.]|nr:hypothetical protein [Treponema sp.]